MTKRHAQVVHMAKHMNLVGEPWVRAPCPAPKSGIAVVKTNNFKQRAPAWDLQSQGLAMNPRKFMTSNN